MESIPCCATGAQEHDPLAVGELAHELEHDLEHELEPDEDWRLEAAVSRQALGSNYLLRRWLPRKGPSFVALVQVLRRHCYRNRETGEQRDWCFLAVETLASECGLSPRTVHRLLADPDMGYFVYRQARRRYSAEHHCQVQTTSLCIIRLDDPPLPEDEAHYAEVEAQVRATWRQEGQEVAEEATEVLPHALASVAAVSLNAPPKWQSVRSAKMAEESDSLNLDFEREIHRFEAPADGEQAPAPPPHVERRITPSPDVPAEHDPEACEAIEDAVHTAQYILQDLGDTRPLAGARGLIRALSAAEAPHAHLRDLLYLARSRVRAHQMRGGTIHNKAAYYVRTAQQLLLEARRASWDLDALGAAG